MPGQSNCYGTSITLLGLGLVLLVLFPTIVMAQQQTPPGETPGGSYSPPMATVLIVLIVVFFLVGLVSIYLRHFAWCLGYETPGGGGGGVWRRQEARGLDPAILESFPTFLYSDVKQHRIGKGTLECAVCINEFEDEEVLRLLPGCSHVFHPDCIRPWLSSHVTCPVCRANLEDQHNSQFDSVLQQLNHQPSEEESEPSIHQINDEVIVGIRPSPEVIKSPVQEIKAGGARMGKLPRSHSTGHSLIDDCERFTLRLPEEVRNKLVNTTPNFCTLPSMVSPRIGFRARSVGCTGMPIKPDRWRFSVSPPFISKPGSTLSPKSDGGGNITPPTGIMSGPRNLLKSIKSPLNPVSRTSDIGERSSDRLWPNRPSQDLELETQQ